MKTEKVQYIVNTDIGSRYVRVVIGEHKVIDDSVSGERESRITILGAGQSSWMPGTFVRSGMLEHSDVFVEALKEAHEQAAYQACRPISDNTIYVATLTPPQVLGSAVEGYWPMMPYTPVDEKEGGVLSEEDQRELRRRRIDECERAKDYARQNAACQNPQWIEIYNDYISLRVEEHEMTRDELMQNCSGKTTLTVKMHVISVPEQYLNNILPVISRYFLLPNINEYCFSGVALSMVTNTDEEAKSGVITVNIGETSTQFVVWKNSTISNSGQICVGMQHLANDLLVAFGLDKSELFVTRYLVDIFEQYGSLMRIDDGSARPINDEVYFRNVEFKRNVYMSDVELVLSCRIRELFSILAKRLENEGSNWKLYKIKLFGEGSKLPGLTEFLSQEFGIQVENEFTLIPDILFASDEVKERVNHTEWGSALGGIVYCVDTEKFMQHRDHKIDDTIKRLLILTKEYVWRKIQRFFVRS